MNGIETKNWLRAALVWSVGLHVVALAWHGSAHLRIPVVLTPLQVAFIIPVIGLVPLVGAGMLWTACRRTAAWLIMLSMLGSLLFGFINHYMRSSPDCVLQVPDHAWRPAFVISAGLLTVTETLGTVLGAIAAVAWRRAA